MKKLFLTLTLLMTFTLAACAQPTLSNETPSFNPQETSTLLTIDINPSITFTLDEDGVITGYVLSNEDAEIVAADLTFIGLTYEDALELFLNAAIETGYVDVTRSDNLVVVTLTSGAESTLASFKEEVENRIQSYLDQRDIEGAVVNGEEYYEELQALADTYGINMGRVILIQAAIQNDPTLTFEEALAIEPETLKDTLKTDFESRIQTYQADYEEEALKVKEEIKAYIETKVAEYQAAVEAGDIDPPTTREALKEVLLEQFSAFRNQLEENAAPSEDE